MKEAPGILLAEMHAANGRGTIEGVRFDFRHPDLGGDWEPCFPIGWGTADFIDPMGLRFRVGHYPRLVYPWTAVRDSPFMRKRATMTGRPLLRSIVKHGPHGWIGRGDKLFVRSVQRFQYPDSEFEADVDSNLMIVRFAIRRGGGRVEALRGRLAYHHRHRTWPESASGGGGQEVRYSGGLSFESVEGRVGTLLGRDRAGRPILTDASEYNARECLLALEAARDEKDLVRRDRDLLRAGYYLAMAETEAKMRPLAIAGLSAKQGGATGGRKSGQVRREWAAENWEPHALRLARKYRERDRSRSQKNLAADVQAYWDVDVDEPGFEWLLGFIRREEAADRIPKRQARGWAALGGSNGVRQTKIGGSSTRQRHS